MVLHPAVVSDVSRIEIGAFVDGPEVALESRPLLPVTGTASYAGNASGMYAVEYAVEYIPPTGGVELANWSDSAQLTVDFGSDMIGGCIGCGRDWISQAYLLTVSRATKARSVDAIIGDCGSGQTLLMEMALSETIM